MKLTRTTKVAALAATGLLALAACSDSGSSDSSSSASASPSNIDCASGTLSAEGSSAQGNAMTEWIKEYQTACPDATVNYNPTGSGAGIQQFLAGQVDFAGSDSALSAEDGEVADAKKRCDNNDAWNLPMVVGPIAVAYNLDGVDNLVLDADTTAGIFNGEIKKWNDSKIADLNSGASLPDADITVFYRSDESGTTDNFTKYLHAAAPDVWTKDPGKAWTGTGEGKPQSAGVQQATIANANSISYMEWSFAKDGGLGVAEIDNGYGSPVTLDSQTAGAALESAKITGSGNDLSMSLDYTTSAANTYPIVLVTYEIVCSAGLPQNTTDLVKSFLTYTAGDGQSLLEGIGYAPLPSSVQSKVETSVAAIK
ncbi:MAG: phosphate ABC transporter substrate-binding protein PstS [Actinobacteria bacterium]|nr:phosphate ABC transporter substrate-binding protein PstS [Actinomycetota bacterium]